MPAPVFEHVALDVRDEASIRRMGDAAHAIERRLYALGWLTQPWQDMVAEAAARLREEPDMLFRMPGIGTQSGLDQ